MSGRQTMKAKLFHLVVIVSFVTAVYYLYSITERTTLTFTIHPNLTNVQETGRRAPISGTLVTCDCCGNQSDWKDEFLRIPKRLHQTYKTDQIPEPYVPLIRSWLDNHPDWEYYFWTDEDAKCLIHDLYPQYFDLYNKYKHKLQRSDAIRYFVLHRFGGVYADMDMRSLRPIEEFLSTNTCVVVPEPYVITRLFYNCASLITNCIMASTAYHPFLTYVLEGLQTAFRTFKSDIDVLSTTGPFFLNGTYYNYLKKFSNKVNRTHSNVYLADFKYLVPRFSKTLDASRHKTICKSGNKHAPIRQAACDELTKTNFSNALPEDAYTDHLWLHLGWSGSGKQKTLPIQTIVPRVKRYGACNI